MPKGRCFTPPVDKWRKTHSYSDKMSDLYTNMLGVFNERFWPEWAGITTEQLLKLANTKNRKAALSARDGLVEAGLLEYRPGWKGMATVYRLLKLECESAPENTEYGYESVTESNTGNAGYGYESVTESEINGCESVTENPKYSYESATENAGYGYESVTPNYVRLPKDFINEDRVRKDFPPNPPKGGTGESFPDSPEPVDSAGTDKWRRQRREQSAALKSELSPEEEAELSAMSPRLRDAVRDWMADKAQRRNPYTPTSKRALIGMVQRNVGQYGADIVAQTIEESTANGYAGIAWSRAAQMKKAKEDEARAQEERKKELPSYGFKIIGDDDGKRTTPEKRWPDFSNW